MNLWEIFCGRFKSRLKSSLIQYSPVMKSSRSLQLCFTTDPPILGRTQPL